MQRAGYYNTYMGKYLNGYGSTPEPGKKTGNSTQYCPPGWDLWRGSVDGGMDPDDPQDGGTYRFFDTSGDSAFPAIKPMLKVGYSRPGAQKMPFWASRNGRTTDTLAICAPAE